MIRATEKGNTSQLSPNSHTRRHRNWVFTWNNFTRKNIIDLEKLNNCQYLFQPEIGLNGTPHLQGCLLFKSLKSFDQLKRMFPEPHFESMKYKREALEYCTKLETKSGPIHTNILQYKEIYDMLNDYTPYKWQQDIINIVSGDPDPRKIHWFWEPKGNVGKTILCKHLILKYQAILVNGKCRDAHYAIATCLKEGNPVTTVIFDIPRSSFGRLSYPALESIKNGLFFSTKYESGQCVFNIPHVIVFANAEPDKSMLSEDRWDINLINEEGSPSFLRSEEGSPSSRLRKE